MTKQKKTPSKRVKAGKSILQRKLIVIPASVFALFSIFLVIIWLVPISENSDCFKNLDEVIAYATAMNEYPSPDNKNLLKPDYTTFYKSNLPGFTNKIKRLFGFGRLPFTMTFFKKLLDGQIKFRQDLGFKDNFIHKLPVKKGFKLVVVGDIQGAFHSLVRDLYKLRDLKLIGNDFKLTSPNYFIILMGDAISRSPYTAETLALILKLMEVNTNQICYLRGNHESNGYWEQHSLKIELDIRASHLSDQKIPLGNEVNAFFNTLPLAVYLQQNGQFVRISPWSATDEKHKFVNENLYAAFLTKPSDKLETFHIKSGQEQYGEEVVLRVVIKSQKKREQFQQMDGLRMISPEMGATAWTLLASPTLSYQKLLKYFHDSFSVIDVGRKISRWTITKYSRHVLKDKDFYSVKYNFLTGREIKPGQEEEEFPEEEKIKKRSIEKDYKEFEELEEHEIEPTGAPAIKRKIRRKKVKPKKIKKRRKPKYKKRILKEPEYKDVGAEYEEFEDEKEGGEVEEVWE